MNEVNEETEKEGGGLLSKGVPSGDQTIVGSKSMVEPALPFPSRPAR